jgi:hypothetical protein
MVVRHDIVPGLVVVDGDDPYQLRTEKQSHRVVHGGSGQRRDLPFQVVEDGVHSRMARVVQQVLENQNPLVGRSDSSRGKIPGKIMDRRLQGIFLVRWKRWNRLPKEAFHVWNEYKLSVHRLLCAVNDAMKWLFT